MPSYTASCRSVRFLFTNGYLAYKFLVNKDRSVPHHLFKVDLANALISFKGDTTRPIRSSIEPLVPAAEPVHVLKVLEKPVVDKYGKEQEFKRYQKYCFYCQHDPTKPPVIQKTSYHCIACVGSNGELYPLCNPDTGRDCFQLHILHGLPQKRRYMK